jgi:nitrate reductase gamma subunit
LILIWLILSIILGVIAVSLRKLPEEKSVSQKDLLKTPANVFKKRWQSWNEFSKRMGSFQSRILLSLFFFVFVSPFAIAVKMFSDPLHLKYQSRTSWWIPKKEIRNELEEFRRQF